MHLLTRQVAALEMRRNEAAPPSTGGSLLATPVSSSTTFILQFQRNEVVVPKAPNGSR